MKNLTHQLVDQRLKVQLASLEHDAINYRRLLRKLNKRKLNLAGRTIEDNAFPKASRDNYLAQKIKAAGAEKLRVSRTSRAVHLFRCFLRSQPYPKVESNLHSSTRDPCGLSRSILMSA